MTALVALAGAALALRLEPSASTDTLVDRGSESFQATERFKEDFGDEAVLVLVRGEVARTVLTADLGRVLRLEGCLSGNVPDTAKGLGRLPPVCREIAELSPAKVVFGPATFINTAVNRIGSEFARRDRLSRRQARQAAAAARELSARRGDPPAKQDRLAAAASSAVRTQFTQQILQLALRYGISGVPRIDDPNFVSSLVFASGEVGVPKARFAYLFPSKNAAMITIRLRPDLSDAERRRAIELFRQATTEKLFRPRQGARYIVTGVPVVVEGLADAVQSAIFVLLGAAVLLMAATLALVFRSRLRLLPLGLALAATAMTFGALSLAGGTLTMASIAVLPVLIGLAVDYAIQFQARFDEAVEKGARQPAVEAAPGGRTDDRHRRAGHGGGLPGAAPVARADGPRFRRPAGARHRSCPSVRHRGGLCGARALRERGAAGARAPALDGPPVGAVGGGSARGPVVASAGGGPHPAAAGARGRSGLGGGGPGARHPE